MINAPPAPGLTEEQCDSPPSLSTKWEKDGRQTNGEKQCADPQAVQHRSGYSEIVERLNYLAETATDMAVCSLSHPEDVNVAEVAAEAAATLERVARERDTWKGNFETAQQHTSWQTATVAAAEAQVEAMRMALEPFAKADLSEWSGSGAVAPFIDRSAFEGAAALASSTPESSAKAQLGEVSMLRKALEDLLSAAVDMPRRTPAPGGASTEHPFQIMAAHVWANDRACEEAAKTLAFLPTPPKA